jgi:hypothetical protein
LPRCLLRWSLSGSFRRGEGDGNLQGAHHQLFPCSLDASSRPGWGGIAGLHELSMLFGRGRDAAFEVRTSLFCVATVVCRLHAWGFSSRDAAPKSVTFSHAGKGGASHQIPGRLLTGRVSELWPRAPHANDTPLGRLDRTAAGETANHFKLGRPPPPFLFALYASRRVANLWKPNARP